MARPYSLDLRDRVVASVEGGRSCRETARLFGVSVASVVKWSQRKHRTGSAAASPMGWRNRPLRLAGERGSPQDPRFPRHAENARIIFRTFCGVYPFRLRRIWGIISALVAEIPMY